MKNRKKIGIQSRLLQIHETKSGNQKLLFSLDITEYADSFEAIAEKIANNEGLTEREKEVIKVFRFPGEVKKSNIIYALKDIAYRLKHQLSSIDKKTAMGISLMAFILEHGAMLATKEDIEKSKMPQHKQ